MDCKNKQSTNSKQNSVEETTEPHSHATQTSSELISDENEKLLALQNRLHATTQLGGKGTMRRRRLRKTASLHQDVSNTEAMRAFLKKFEFSDYGAMECVTLVEETGKVTSYDAVNLNANLKSGIFHLNLSQYKHVAQRKRSRTKTDEKSKSQSPAPSIPSGVRVDTAENLLHTLAYYGVDNTTNLAAIQAWVIQIDQFKFADAFAFGKVK